MDTQLEFFRHLKFHYEPTELIPPVKAEMKGKTVVAAVKTSKKPPVPVVAETAVDRSKRLRVCVFFLFLHCKYVYLTKNGCLKKLLIELE